MNVLFDTNVILDALLDREPWAEPAVDLFDRVEAGRTIGYLGATTLTTIHYIARRNVGTTAAQRMTKDLLQLFEVAPVNRAVLEGASLGFEDFEDAVLHEAGRLAGATAVVTRDTSGFSGSSTASTPQIRWSPPSKPQMKTIEVRRKRSTLPSAHPKAADPCSLFLCLYVRLAPAGVPA